MSGWTTGEAEAGAATIRGHIVLTDEDVRLALKDQARQYKWHWLILVPVLGGLVYQASTAPSTDSLLTTALPLVLLVVMFVAFIGLGYKNAAKRVMANKTDGERDVTFAFDTRGYRIDTRVTSTTATWDSVHLAQEGATSFLVYTAANLATIVPKRAFAESDVPRLRALLADYVKARPQSNPIKRTIILWVVLIVMFLAIWQLLNTDKSGQHRGRRTDDTAEPRDIER